MARVSKKYPLISIVVPIYNAEKNLKNCIDSLLNQTYKNIEIILVNDGSKDNSGKICDAYKNSDSRIKIIHKKNGGVSDARNSGIQIATGEYITFADSDDYVSEDYIEYMYNMLRETNTKLAICKVKIVWKNTPVFSGEGTNFRILTTEEAFKNLLFQQGIEVAVYAKLYERKVFDNIKFPVGEVYEDTAVIYKIINKYDKIAFGDKECYFYVAREGSISKHKAYNQSEEFYIKYTDKMLNYINKFFPNLEDGVNRYYVYSRFRILRMLMYLKPRNRAMEKSIIKEIKARQKGVLNCKSTPKRDKIAIYLLSLGMPIFKLSWSFYCKLTGRIS